MLFPVLDGIEYGIGVLVGYEVHVGPSIVDITLIDAYGYLIDQGCVGVQQVVLDRLNQVRSIVDGFLQF